MQDRAQVDRLLIREATTGDARSIADIFNHYISLSHFTMEEVVWTEESTRRTLESLGQRESYLVAEQNGEVRAWGCVLSYSSRQGYRATCVTSLYVSPDATGQGIGQRMIKCLFARCASLNYHHLVAKIVASNEGSIRFHERMGFTLVGIQKQAGIINGKYVDIALMQKLLGE